MYTSSMSDMDFPAFQSLIADLARLNGISEDEAGEIAARIGDTPELDGQGRAVVDGRAYVIAFSGDDDERLNRPIFSALGKLPTASAGTPSPPTH